MSTTRWPGESDEVHPDVFNKVPTYAKYEGKPGQVSDDDIKKYFRDGYLIVDNFFDPSELNPVRDAVEVLVDELAEKLYKAGKIKDLYKKHGLFKRLSKLEEEYPGANIVLLKTGIGRLPQAFRNLWTNDRLLNLVEQFVGPDVAGHPIWNLRTKTPKNEATLVPWHQDAAYMSTDAYNVFIFSAWIPLVDVDERNGCLQFAKNGHRKGKIARHTCCAGGTFYVELEDGWEKTLGVDLKKDSVSCAVPYGGLVLFNNILPHRSLSNVSEDIRWSIDLRWYKPGQPAGLWNMKEGVVMRSSTDPDLQIDWESFEALDRTKLQEQNMGYETVDEFDTTLQGPWMRQWKIVHHNRHTESFKDDPAKWAQYA